MLFQCMSTLTQYRTWNRVQIQFHWKCLEFRLRDFNLLATWRFLDSRYALAEQYISFDERRSILIKHAIYWRFTYIPYHYMLEITWPLAYISIIQGSNVRATHAECCLNCPDRSHPTWRLIWTTHAKINLDNPIPKSVASTPQISSPSIQLK